MATDSGSYQVKKNFVFPKCFLCAVVLSKASNDYLLILFLYSTLSIRGSFPGGEKLFKLYFILANDPSQLETVTGKLASEKQ